MASPGTGGSAAGAAGSSSGLGGGAGAAGAAGYSPDASADAPPPTDGGSSDLGPAGAACEQTPAPLRQTGSVLELPFEMVFDGQPFVYGETNVVAPGKAVIPLNVRFYVSQVQLLTAGGGSVPVDIVTSAGAPQPYGVFLFNAESATAQTLRVLAPPGSYTGLTFALGLNVACNRGGPSGRSFPLSEDSQMSWPHLTGYLFLRYESLVSSTVVADAGAADAGGAANADGGVAVPRAIHLGANLRDLTVASAIVVRLDGSLSVSPTGTARKPVRVAMDQIFKGATTSVDLSDYPFVFSSDEVVAGELLRRNGPGLPLFVFGP